MSHQVAVAIPDDNVNVFSNTTGNIEIGTAPGFELIATAEGTIEGAQFKLVANTANTANAETFGLKEGTTERRSF